MLDVELYRFVDPDDPAYISWSAKWRLHDGSQGVEGSNENIQELVNAAIEDARHWTHRFDLRIEWIRSGNPPPGGTVADAVVAACKFSPSMVSPLVWSWIATRIAPLADLNRQSCDL